MKKSCIILFSYLLLIASTCEEDIDIPNETSSPKLVITSEFGTGNFIKLYIMSSLPVLNPEPVAYVDDAVAELYQKGVKVDDLFFDGDGHLSTIIPAEGEEYTIKVSADGFESVEATGKIPVAIESFNTTVNELQSNKIEDSFFDLEFNFNATVTIDDPENETNYYHLKFYIRDSTCEFRSGMLTKIESRSASLVLKDPINNSPALPYFNGALIKDKSFNGQSQEFEFNFTNEVFESEFLSSRLEVELLSVSEEYYLYHSSLYRQSIANGIPLSEPVQVFSNIENGFGIFGGYSFVTKLVDIE